jgi:hypothetical protein
MVHAAGAYGALVRSIRTGKRERRSAAGKERDECEPETGGDFPRGRQHMTYSSLALLGDDAAAPRAVDVPRAVADAERALALTYRARDRCNGAREQRTERQRENETAFMNESHDARVSAAVVLVNRPAVDRQSTIGDSQRKTPVR